MTLTTVLQNFPSLLPANVELGTSKSNQARYTIKTSRRREGGEGNAILITMTNGPTGKQKPLNPELLVFLGLALTFAEDAKIFITKTNCRPHLKVLKADLYGLCCILEQTSLIQIHQKLASSSMQFSYKRQTIKTHSVETG